MKGTGPFEHSPIMNVDKMPKLELMSKHRILKNLIVVCLGFLFLFSAYQGLANLQSTLNIEGNVGIISQSVIYAALILSSLFLPKLVIRRFGCKLTLAMSILMYAPYIASNFYPHISTLVPTAVLVGLGAAPLWSAKCTYLNEISALYSSQTTDTIEVITSRFFGIFFMVFQNTQIWGNLVSFFVLRPSSERTHLMNHLTNVTFNLSQPLQEDVICGADFCSGINENLMSPSDDKRYMLVGIYTSCCILASLIVLVFLDSLPNKAVKDKEESTFSRIVATFIHMKKKDQILLIPLTIFSGTEQAFILGEYTQAYVACSWGLYHVGLVFICFGVVNAIMSYVVGYLLKYVPRFVLMLTAMAGNVVVCVVLFLWIPTAESPEIFFVLIGVWGLSDAIWQTQVNSYYGVLFRSETEAAFSNYRLWESVGFFLAFGYSTFLCVAPKIYILLAFLIAGMIGYLTVEMRNYKRKTYEFNPKQNK